LRDLPAPFLEYTVVFLLVEVVSRGFASPLNRDLLYSRTVLDSLFYWKMMGA
jgi:hypothetical protein